MHPTLQRQLMKLGLAAGGPPPDATTWEALLERISGYYTEADQDRYLLERSLDISSGEMQDLYKALENAVEGISRVDAAGRFATVNTAFAGMAGATPHELIGQPWLDLFEPGDRPMLATALSAIRAGGARAHLDCRMCWRHQESTHQQIVLVADHRSHGFYCFAMDITDRKAAEAALRASEERFQALVRSLDDRILVLDREGRITHTYGNWQHLTGLPRSGVIGWRFGDVLGDPDGSHAEAHRRTMAGESFIYEWSQAFAGNDLRRFQTAMSPMRDAHGEVHAAVRVTRDITDLERLRSQLFLSDRMASMGTLAAGVAHEINNPLAAVLANLELVDGFLGDIPDWPGSQEVWECLDGAREAADRVHHIVRDLKVFSRSEEETVRAVDVHEVLESTVRLAANEIRHRARLLTRYTSLPPVVAIPSRLGQVFLNLVINAAQAIPEGHADDHMISLSTRLDEQGRVTVAVSDTGNGMAPEALARLFTPFYTTKPAGVGTGLGLVICHRIVTGFGGEITVSSAVGEGTTVNVHLPAAAALRPAVPPTPPMPQSALVPPSPGRILVVDDDVLVGEAIRRTLTAEHDVTVVTSAADALSLLQEGRCFDVILCDVMMPVTTGIDFYHSLAARQPDLAGRVIFLTGGAFTPAARAFLDGGGRTCLEKPFSMTALRAVIRERLLHPRRPVDQGACAACPVKARPQPQG
jgi:PAS domain S-box-containing protein